MQRVCYDDPSQFGKKQKVHIATLMDTCHLQKKKKTRCLNQKFQNRVVPRGVSVQDDSGAYAVFTHKGPSVSEMTALKVMDVKTW